MPMLVLTASIYVGLELNLFIVQAGAVGGIKITVTVGTYQVPASVGMLPFSIGRI